MEKMPSIKMPSIDMKRMLGFAKKEHCVIGIDIGSHSLKIAGMRLGQIPSVLFSSITDIPDEKRDLYIQEAIGKALRQRDIHIKDAVLTFSDESAIFRRIELPAIPEKEILEALVWKAKDVAHIDISGASMDYKVLSQFQKEDGSKAVELIFAAVSNESINGKVNILRNAGLNATAVNMPPFGLEKILGLDQTIGQSDIVAIIDFGHIKTEVSIFKNKTLDFVRTIPLGGRDISGTLLQRPIASDKGDVTFSKGDAEDIKRKIGISYEDVTLESGVTSRQILAVMRPTLERIAKEIRRSIEYYLQEFGSAGKAKIYMIGGGARLKNLDRYLSEELNIPISKMTLPSAIDIQRPSSLDKEDLLPFIGLIGAALSVRDRFNLLPREDRLRKMELIESVSIRMAAIIMAAILIVSFLFTRLQVEDYNRRFTSAPLQKIAIEQIKGLEGMVIERQTVLSQLQRSELPIDKIMKEMSNVIPQNIILRNLTIIRADKTLNMTGMVYGPKSYAQPILARFMEDLEKSRYFKDAQLSFVQSEDGDKEPVSSFSITCMLE